MVVEITFMIFLMSISCKAGFFILLIEAKCDLCSCKYIQVSDPLPIQAN